MNAPVFLDVRSAALRRCAAELLDGAGIDDVAATCAIAVEEVERMVLDLAEFDRRFRNAAHLARARRGVRRRAARVLAASVLPLLCEDVADMIDGVTLRDEIDGAPIEGSLADDASARAYLEPRLEAIRLALQAGGALPPGLPFWLPSIIMGRRAL